MTPDALYCEVRDSPQPLCVAVRAQVSASERGMLGKAGWCSPEPVYCTKPVCCCTKPVYCCTKPVYLWLCSTSKKDSPKWFMVDVKYKAPLPRYVSLSELKRLHQEHAGKGGPLKNMALFTRARLSVQPVSQGVFVSVCVCVCF